MFVVRMAWREMRWSWRRLLFFFLCLAIGVGSIVTLRSVVQNVRAALTGRGAHPAGRGRRRVDEPPVGAGRPEPDRPSRGTVPGVARRFEVLETLTMVRPADARKAVARLVELLGVEPAYPLYGALELDGGRATRTRC